MNTEVVLFIYLSNGVSDFVFNEIMYHHRKLYLWASVLLGFSGMVYGLLNDHPNGNTEGGSLLICTASSLFMGFMANKLNEKKN